MVPNSGYLRYNRGQIDGLGIRVTELYLVPMLCTQLYQIEGLD